MAEWHWKLYIIFLNFKLEFKIVHLMKCTFGKRHECKASGLFSFFLWLFVTRLALFKLHACDSLSRVRNGWWIPVLYWAPAVTNHLMLMYIRSTSLHSSWNSVGTRTSWRHLESCTVNFTLKKNVTTARVWIGTETLSGTKISQRTH